MEEKPAQKKVLLIEYDRTVRDLIVLGLERRGYIVDTSSQPYGLLPRILDTRPDLILLDTFLPGWNGFDFLEILKKNGCLTWSKVIVISGMGFQEIVTQSILFGAADFIVKPVDLDLLAMKVRCCLSAQDGQKIAI